jgi:hypothetical protein
MEIMKKPPLIVQFGRIRGYHIIDNGQQAVVPLVKKQFRNKRGLVLIQKNSPEALALAGHFSGNLIIYYNFSAYYQKGSPVVHKITPRAPIHLLGHPQSIPYDVGCSCVKACGQTEPDDKQS